MEENIGVSIMMKSKIFDGFSREECEIIYNRFRPSAKHFDKGEIVINDGDVVKDICILYRGKLIGIKFYYEGDTQLMRTFEPGEVIAIEAISSSLKTSPLTFVADEKTEVMLFSICVIEQQTEKSVKERLMSNMLHILADNNIKLIYKTEILSKRALRDRIMTYLSIMHEKRGDDCFRIMMNQDQFAQYLCVNRSALSYELNQMKREEIITFDKDVYSILRK